MLFAFILIMVKTLFKIYYGGLLFDPNSIKGSISRYHSKTT